MAEKTPRKRKAPAAPKAAEPKPQITELPMIDTDRLNVKFDLGALKITYTIKDPKEVLEQSYRNDMGMRIIHGRLSRDPHGVYAQQCIAKARIDKLRHVQL